MPGAQTKKKILIIDDDPAVITVIRSRLENAGYEVEEANSAKEGLSKMKGYHPDLVVLDVVMGDSTGYEVCATIKADHRQLPVILLTSRIRVADEKLGYACKADAYIRKPLSGKLLVPEVQKQLSRAGVSKLDSIREGRHE